ncbi:phage holin family protein [Lysinibacillus sp. 1 U-2021]|uniref:phage holin family protein n=1 Tax=Lysinibacillus sp. 1 U-2021 TaxID=3039426 RepID=UPI00248009C4|nr:phage holin family protein [Lysinibacillus sp. 1 U-2021]WGT39404.1 phage holin family protein [Lysinibacillus sp. 1 U-2021]
MEQSLKFLLSTVGGVVSWLVGGWGLLMTVLLILNAVDLLTGMAANWGIISSKRFYQGIIKKGMMWVWIVVANLIYLVLQDQGFSIGQIIPDAVVLMFILNELVSLGENSAKLGVDMPSPVIKALDIFSTKEEKAK